MIECVSGCLFVQTEPWSLSVVSIFTWLQVSIMVTDSPQCYHFLSPFTSLQLHVLQLYLVCVKYSVIVSPDLALSLVFPSCRTIMSNQQEVTSLDISNFRGGVKPWGFSQGGGGWGLYPRHLSERQGEGVRGAAWQPGSLCGRSESLVKDSYIYYSIMLHNP